MAVKKEDVVKRVREQGNDDFSRFQTEIDAMLETHSSTGSVGGTYKFPYGISREVLNELDDIYKAAGWTTTLFCDDDDQMSGGNYVLILS